MMKKNIILKNFIIGLLIILVTAPFTYNKIQNLKNKIIGHLLEKRAGHSAIILPNSNRVLFVGGSNGISNFYLPNAELYNIVTGENERIISTNLPHALPNLFINSDNNIALIDNNGIEVFDTNQNKFKLIKENPFDIDNYFNETQQIQISTNSILITGGKKNYKITKNAYLYNIKSNKILNYLTLNVPRSNHQMISYNNEIYIFGGISNNIPNSLLVEKYTPKTNKFTIIGNIKDVRTDFKIYSYGNYIILAGGLGKNNIEVYDIIKNKSHIYKNFTIRNGENLKNSNFDILKASEDSIIFIYKNKSKHLSGIYTYNFKTEKVNLIKKLSIGNYSNILFLDENEFILSGGETQYQFLSGLTSLFITKTCIKGKICTTLPISNRIKRINMKGVL